MRLFFDANILLDIITKRQPHAAKSQAVLDTCDEIGATVFIAWHSLATAFYIFARQQNPQMAGEALKDALTVMTVTSVGQNEALRAFALSFADLEDAMQAAAAEAAGAQFIITRDAGGFAGSPVPALTPEAFVARFQATPG